jgi:ABC-type sugar transport system, permease component
MKEKKIKQTKMQTSFGSKTFDVILTVIMCFLILIIMYPFLNIIAISLSSPSAISTGMVTWYPVELNLKGYEMVFGNPRIWGAYGNSLMYAILGTTFSLLFTSMIAYALAIKEFVLRKPITILLTITMFFSGGMVPNYILIQQLGLMNTIWSVILPGCVAAYNIFIYRSFFSGISTEMREAAYMDGASDIKILFKIYYPLSKALFATFGLFAIVGYWNMWFEPLLYLKDSTRHPIQLILRQILFNSGLQGMSGAMEMVNQQMLNPKNVQYAVIIATILPVLIIYPFLQKYFEKGMMIGAVKG